MSSIVSAIMEPDVYPLPTGETPISPGTPVYCDQAPRPLVKYGFTTIRHYDYSKIVSDPHYPASLDVYLDSDSRARVTESLGIDKAQTPLLEVWEICALFGLWDGVERVLAPGCRTIMNTIGRARGLEWQVDNKARGEADLVVYRISSDNLEESLTIELTVETLGTILSGPRAGGDLVLQLPRTETEITAEIVTYLASQFETAYLVRPAIMNSLQRGCYLVGRGFREGHTSVEGRGKGYLHSLGVRVDQGVDLALACLAGSLSPAFHRQYCRTLAYLNSKVYDTELADRYQEGQRQKIGEWLEMVSTAPSRLDGLVSEERARCPPIPEDLLESDRVL